jgi:hypothetical protein
VQEFKKLPAFPATCRLITADAVSMDTNIDTAHALSILKPLVTCTTYTALELIMNNNIFRFSDTYWQQLNGTAMGTPPACMWATIYYAGKEDSLQTRFKQYLLFINVISMTYLQFGTLTGL